MPLFIKHGEFQNPIFRWSLSTYTVATCQVGSNIFVQFPYTYQQIMLKSEHPTDLISIFMQREKVKNIVVAEI
jgi:hypothetical protein